MSQHLQYDDREVNIMTAHRTLRPPFSHYLTPSHTARRPWSLSGRPTLGGVKLRIMFYGHRDVK